MLFAHRILVEPIGLSVSHCSVFIVLPAASTMSSEPPLRTTMRICFVMRYEMEFAAISSLHGSAKELVRGRSRLDGHGLGKLEGTFTIHRPATYRSSGLVQSPLYGTFFWSELSHYLVEIPTHAHYAPVNGPSSSGEVGAVTQREITLLSPDSNVMQEDA